MQHRRKGLYLSIPGLVMFALSAQSQPALDTAFRCLSGSSPLAMEATCLHSALTSACSADDWAVYCKVLSEFDEKARTLVERTHAGVVSEEVAREQLVDTVFPDRSSSSQESDHLMDSADNGSMVFSSTHNVTRIGSTVSIWFRSEYQAPQENSWSWSYLSSVSRVDVNCTKQMMRTTTSSWYRKNNLEGESTSSVFDDKSSIWSPAVPGTMGEFLTNFTCSIGRAPH
jgi:hypothetical protein